VRREDIQIRDPFIVPSGGKYYLFGSTDPDIWKGRGVGFDVWTSDGDLREFEGPKAAFRPPAGFWSERNFWAPEVHAYRGAWYMFATFLVTGARRGTAVLRSRELTGPFEPTGPGPVTPPDWECLDGTLYLDRAGRPWTVFCHEWTQVGDGEIRAMPLSDDLSKAAGDPALLFRASEAPWTAPLKGRAPGSYVTDGPFLHRLSDGTLLLLWSSFDAEGAYCLGAARSEGGELAGPWIQEEKPIVAGGAGHGMVFRSYAGTLFLALHSPNRTPEERLELVELVERGGSLRARYAREVTA